VVPSTPLQEYCCAVCLLQCVPQPSSLLTTCTALCGDGLCGSAATGWALFGVCILRWYVGRRLLVPESVEGRNPYLLSASAAVSPTAHTHTHATVCTGGARTPKPPHTHTHTHTHSHTASSAIQRVRLLTILPPLPHILTSTLTNVTSGAGRMWHHRACAAVRTPIAHPLHPRARSNETYLAPPATATTRCRLLQARRLQRTPRSILRWLPSRTHRLCLCS
jgi:hypothetical protein